MEREIASEPGHMARSFTHILTQTKGTRMMFHRMKYCYQKHADNQQSQITKTQALGHYGSMPTFKRSSKS
jgi:hypothetical protein